MSVNSSARSEKDSRFASEKSHKRNESSSSNRDRYKRSSNFTDDEDDYDHCKEFGKEDRNGKARALKSREAVSGSKSSISGSPLKRNNNGNIADLESPNKRLKMLNFETGGNVPIKKFNLNTPKHLNKASVSLCIQDERKSFASTPKSERKTSATSRIKSLNASEAVQRNLSNNWGDILEELEEQTKDLNEYAEKVAQKYKLDKETLLKQLETDPETLRKRQKRVNFGKVTPEYQRYILEIAKRKRQPYHPTTPNKFRKCSRRKFDGLVKKWRKLLHVWDENPDALQDFKYSLENEDPDDEKDNTDEFGGCSGISYNVDDYDLVVDCEYDEAEAVKKEKS